MNFTLVFAFEYEDEMYYYKINHINSVYLITGIATAHYLQFIAVHKKIRQRNLLIELVWSSNWKGKTSMKRSDIPV